MNITTLVLVVIVSFSLIVGLMVLLVDLKRYASWLFFLLIVSMDLWILTGNQSNLGDVWILSTDLFFRLDFVFGVVAAYLFFLFCYSFPKSLEVRKVVKSGFGLLTTVFAVLAFTGLLVQKTSFSSQGSSYVPGLLDYPLVLCITFMIVVGFRGLLSQIRVAEPSQKIQAKYTALSVVFPATVILASLFIIRLHSTIWGWSELTLSIVPNFARFSYVIFVLVTAYAIVRHQYLGIRIAFGRLVFWFGASGILFTIYYLVVYIEQEWFGTFVSIPVVMINGVLAFLVALLFGAYDKNVRRFIDRQVWRFDLNVDEIVEQYKQEIEVLQEPEEVVEALFRTMKGLVHIEKHGIFYALSGGKNEVSYTRWDNFSREDIAILEDQEGINILLENLEGPDPIMRHDLMGLQVFEKQFQLLKALGIDAIVPFNKDGLFGAYLLSLKASSATQAFLSQAEKNLIRELVGVVLIRLKT